MDGEDKIKNHTDAVKWGSLCKSCNLQLCTLYHLSEILGYKANPDVRLGANISQLLFGVGPALLDYLTTYTQN